MKRALVAVALFASSIILTSASGQEANFAGSVKRVSDPEVCRSEFYNYSPATSTGRNLWNELIQHPTIAGNELILSTGQLLLTARTESPRICSKKNEKFGLDMAPKVAEAWAIKYHKHGRDSQRFLDLALKGFSGVRDDDPCLKEVMERIEIRKNEYETSQNFRKLEELKSLTGRGERIIFGLHDLLTLDEKELPKHFRASLILDRPLPSLQ
jgi:hypothetical protein